jgi:cation diffusion facilitator CzcD-associated flavoprotein CzcO
LINRFHAEEDLMTSVTGEDVAGVQERDAVVVGAGFAGLYMLYRLRELGLTFAVFETADGPGGTWYWNRYPGARVDGESLSYSYGFDNDLQQQWSWSQNYAPQPELLAYANHVADRFDLRKDIQFNTTVTSAVYDDRSNRWIVETDRGERVAATYFITAAGCLSATNVPAFEGLDDFRGQWIHTSRWPKEGVDFAGQRVGVIGTGSTGIQAIPVIAEQAEHLFVFQRTPNYSIPTRNRPMDREFERAWKADYPQHRVAARLSPGGHDLSHLALPDRSALEASEEERRRVYEAAWGRQPQALLMSFNDIRSNLAANDTLAEFVRGKIRETVIDPAVAELLCPKDYPIGTKRICLDTDYYQTFNRDNVTLVDVKTNPIERITPAGVQTTLAEYPLDAIVFATGFDAMTGPLLRMNIVGEKGTTLRDKWNGGPRTYLGLSTVGFPNMFMITGPGSPSVLSNMLTSIEQHVDWITRAIQYMRDNDYARIEATLDAENAWVDHVNDVADTTLYKRANSWYMGANIPGKARVFMPYIGGVGRYRLKCDAVAENGYEGFELA